MTALFFCNKVLTCVIPYRILLEKMMDIKGRRQVKHSINRQFTSIFIAIMALTILLCWFLNTTLLEKYYIRNKQTVLLEAYSKINRAAEEGKINTNKFDLELRNLCGRYNLDVLVVDVDSQTLKFTGKDLETTKLQLWDNIFLKDQEEAHPVLEQTDTYQIQIVDDKRMKNENIEMWGNLDNGNLFIIRTALESIKDSVRIANNFLGYVGVTAILISGVVIWLISKKITKPILELTNISDQMTRLDFEAKYTGNCRNEIGLLGDNFNQMSAALEQTISELKTANNELKKDIAKKTEIDEMRKEFLSNVSHELKTPIAVIQGYAEGLAEGINEDDAGREYYCSVICDEAAKMNSMVKKLLTLNQLEFGNDTITMERFDLVTLIENCVHTTEILAKQNKITVNYPKDNPIFAWGDEFMVEEVFTNYLSNAMNHCENKKIIDVQIEKLDGKVRVTVFNTGAPIPEDSIEHIWEKFYKVDKARTRAYGGSGVGLSIVKAIMDSMNQKYGVTNYENGVAFWFELELGD